MAMILRPRRAKTVALVDDQNGAAMLARGLSNLLKRVSNAEFPSRRPYRLPRTRLLSLKRIESSLFASATSLIGNAFCHGRLAGSYVAVKDHQRILLGDEIADRELAAL